MYQKNLVYLMSLRCPRYRLFQMYQTTQYHPKYRRNQKYQMFVPTFLLNPNYPNYHHRLPDQEAPSHRLYPMFLRFLLLLKYHLTLLHRLFQNFHYSLMFQNYHYFLMFQKSH
jgi:hypothetical protein